MRIEVAGEGANARHVHPIGERDLRRGAADSISAEEVTVAVRFVPARAIQVKRGETRITLSVDEVLALFDDVVTCLDLSWAEVQQRLEDIRRGRAAPEPAAARLRDAVPETA